MSNKPVIRKTMLFAKFVCILISAFMIQTIAAEEYELVSPNGKLKVGLQVDKGTKYKISYDGIPLMELSPVALHLDDGTIVGAGAVKETETKSVNAVIPVAFGKNKTLDDIYNELIIHFNGRYSLIFRAYDDGMAWRFQTAFETDTIIVKSEDAIFNFAGEPVVYFPTADNFEHWEKSYDIYTKIADIKSDAAFAVTPVLLSYPGTNYKVALLESDLFDYPGLYIQKNGSNSLKGMWALYPDKVQEPDNFYSNHIPITRFDYVARTSANRTFPWRVVIVSDDDKSLLNNEIVYKLATPQLLTDISWIEPGLTAWEWGSKAILEGVNFPSGGGTVNLSFDLYRYYVDFAARNNIPYITLDAGWSESYIRRLCNYAKAQNVKIIVWTWATCVLEYERNGLDWLQRMYDFGISGAKIDFFNRSDQLAIRWAEQIAKRSAELNMVVIYHGCPVPTGLHRAYPNILNYEAVRGSENNYWDRTANPDYNLEIPFIRMLAGPFDYTPGSMHNVTKTQFRPIDTGEQVPGTIPNVMGTRCHQLGMYVIFDQPLGYLVDSPTEYEKYPDILDFFSKVPTVWDKTVPLSSELGKYAVMAKQSGNNWFVGGMNNWSRREVEVDFSFLPDEKQYNAVVYRDSSTSNGYPKRYVYEEIKVSGQTKMNIQMADGGGFVIRLYPADDSGLDDVAKKEPGVFIHMDHQTGILSIESEEMIRSVSMFNTSGQLMMKQNVTDHTNEKHLNVSNLREGVYIVEVRTETSVDSVKFIY